MRLISFIFVGLFSLYIQAEDNICKNSPVTLNNKLDWETYYIDDWNNCFGVLKQNYGNKKKWKGIFKDGLPNGYGTVKYENWDGHYQGNLVDGKMHGKGKYFPYKGKKINLNCLDNNCKKTKVDTFNNKYEKSKIISNKPSLNLKSYDNIYKNTEKNIYKNVRSFKNQKEINIISNSSILNNTFNNLNVLPKRKSHFNNQKNITIIHPVKNTVQKPFKAYK